MMRAMVGAVLLVLGTMPAMASELVIKQFVIAKQVVNHDPEGITDQIPASNSLAFAFTRFDNIGPTEPVTYVWYLDGKEMKRATQQIGTSSGWRSYTQMRVKPGRWRVDLIDGSGAVIADREFEVK